MSGVEPKQRQSRPLPERAALNPAFPDNKGGKGLGREALATLGAAAGDHGATPTGGHAGAETVATGTHKAAGLECTLHRGTSLLLFERYS